MQRTRYLVAVTLVAAALCADRGVAAAPAVRPTVGESAKHLAGRLMGSFRQELAAVRLSPVRRAVAAVVPTEPMIVADPAVVVHPFEPTAFAFRLPPPSV